MNISQRVVVLFLISLKLDIWRIFFIFNLEIHFSPFLPFIDVSWQGRSEESIESGVYETMKVL